MIDVYFQEKSHAISELHLFDTIAVLLMLSMKVCSQSVGAMSVHNFMFYDTCLIEF